MGKRSLSSRFIATTNNQVLFPRNQDVHDANGKVIPKVGQPVLWVPNTNKSIDATDLPTTNVFELAVVTQQLVGNKKVKRLTTINGSDWDLCKDSFFVTNTLPQCAVPQKVNMYFDCVDPYGEKGVSIAIEYRDYYTQLMYGGDGTKQWQFNYAPPNPTDCEGCPNPNVSCWDYACGLAWEINRYNGKDKEIEQVGLVNKGDSIYFPIKAAAVPYGRLLHKVCLSPGSTDCASCNVLTGLETLTITKSTDSAGEAITPVVTNIDLTQFTENDLTDVEQVLTEIQEYLTEQLKGIAVFVNIAGGMGKCCQYEIEIGGCLDSAVLTTATGPIPFVTEDPWIDIPVSSFCKPCGEPGTPYSPKCLIRFYTESITASCNCGLPATNLNFNNFYKQIIDIHGLEGFRQDKLEVHFVQKQQYPFNMGHTFITLLESRQSIGGRGANMWEGGEFYGKYPQQMNNHKFWDALFNIKCETAYCSVNLLVKKGDEGWPVGNYHPSTSEAETLLLIPTTDNLTFASIKTVFDYFATLGRCNKITWSCFDPLIATSVVITGAATDAMEVGDTPIDLGTTTTPGTAPNTGTWTSSVPAVATVNETTGVVTPVAIGITLLTFTATSNPSVKAYRTVEVVA
jgi:hypothetical protein